MQFTVEQTPIRMYVQEPENPTEGKHAAIILLHGAGGNLDFWTSRFGPFLQQAGIALYAPHYFDRTGTVRADFAMINDGAHVPKWLATIDEAVRVVANRPNVDPQRIVLAGISLGAFLSLALAADLSASKDMHQRQRLRAVLEISGGLIEPHASRATDQFPPTLILHGAQDNVVPVSHAKVLEQRLTELNVAHRTEILANEGHWFSSRALPRILLAVSGFLENHIRPSREAQHAM